MAARILVVEDNAANLQLMTYLLKAFGHTPMVAHDGEEALDIIGRETFDLILCDVQLPRVDGFEVARRLKSDPNLCTLPLVAVTALAMVGDRDKVLAAGFDGYLAKPIVPQTFVKQVEAFLQPGRQSSVTPPAPPPAAGPAPHAPDKGVTILVVDNSPINVTLTRKILEPFGYQVVAATTADEALHLAHRKTPNLILSDLHMPHRDGFDLIREVKADSGLREIPFVFISSTLWHEQDRARGESLGAKKFLVRPIEPQALLAEIEACLPPRKEPKHGEDPHRR